MGLLTQTSGSYRSTVDASVSTGRLTTAIPASISPLQSPLALPVDAKPTPEAAHTELRATVSAYRIQNDQEITVTLLLNVVTPTQELSTVSVVPEGMEYVGASDADAYYETATRQLTWRNNVIPAGMQLSRAYRFKVHVPTTPATLALSTTLSGAADIPQQLPQIIQVGDDRVSPVVNATAGGRVQVSDRVTLDFPANALQVDTSIASATYLPYTPSKDDPDAPVLQFVLGPEMAFNAPVTFTADLRGMFSADVLSRTGRLPTLQYLFYETITPTIDAMTHAPITATQLRVVDIPSSYDAQSGLLVSHIEHFSTYDVGLQQPVNPQPWMLSPNGGEVNLFRGSVNYAYPINVPPMQDGLQPDVTLRYSSATADGKFDQQYQPGENLSIGLGWSLQAPKITRRTKRDWVCFGSVDWQGQCSASYAYNGSYANDFTLSLNGQTYYLQPKTDTGNGGEYVTEQYAPLRILRCTARYTAAQNPLCSISVTNQTGEYWQVWTPDGTRYVFGSDTQSENIVRMAAADWQYYVEYPYDPNTNAYSGYAGEKPGYIGRAWFLRNVYAVNRDSAAGGRWSAQYTYETGANTVTAPFWGCPNTCGYPSEPDYTNRPASILYGPSIKADGSAATQRYKVAFTYGWGPRLIAVATSLADASGNTTQWLRQYLLGTGNGQPLDSVEEQYWNGTGWQSGLPRSTFTYADYTHNNTAKQLLAKVANGYGGEWAYAYEGDQGWNSYWVVTATVRGGADSVSLPMTRTYSYSSRDANGWCIAISSAACYNAQHSFVPPNSLVGWAQVTETVRNATGTPVAMTTHRFHYNELHRLGLEYETRALDQSLATLQAQDTDFVALQADAGLPANVWFNAPMTVTAYPAGDVGVNTGFYRQVVNSYDAALQGGAFYGQVTGIKEFESGTLLRATTTRYAINTTNWVLKPVSQTVTSAAGERVSGVYYYYDGAGVAAGSVITGSLTYIQELVSVSPTERTRDTAVAYDVFGNKASVSVFLDSGVPYSLTVADRPTAVTSALYDPASGAYVISMSNPLTQVARYDYFGVNSIGLQDGDGATYGLLKAITDTNGAATEYRYDAFGRLAKVIRPFDSGEMPTVQYTYTAPYTTTGFTGLKIEEAQRTASGCVACVQSTLSFYDGLGRPQQTRAPFAPDTQVVVNTKYDALGKVTWSNAPVTEAVSTQFTRTTGWDTRPGATTQYDALGRPVIVTNTDGTTVTSAYLGTTTIVTDANGHRKTSTADAYGRLQTVVEYSGTAAYTTTYSYDALNNLTRVVDALGNTTVITYDALGRKSAMADPDMGVWSYGYDPVGNLITQTNALSQTLWFKYDGLNRLTEKRLNNANGVLLAGFGYDQGANGIGHRTFMSNTNSSAGWQYDVRGRMSTYTTSIAGANNGVVFSTYYTYDASDRVVQMQYPTGELVTTTYDAAGRPVSLTNSFSYSPIPDVLVTGATYNALGLPVRIDFGNGLRARYTYFGLEWLAQGNPLRSYGRLRQACVIAQTAADCPDAGTPDALLNMAYAYDSAGNVTNIGDRTLGAHHLFGYDALNRLVSVAQSYTQAYAYDALGNVTSKPIVSGTGTVDVAYTYGVTQPHAVRSQSNGSSFQYDANGNMTQRVEMSATQLITYTQAYDVDNRLIAITSSLGYTSTFYYSADGERVKKLDSNGGWFYIGNILEKDMTRNVRTTYYYLGSQRVAMRVAPSGPYTGTLYWIHADHLGSASLTTNISGTAVSEMRYYPFGEVRWISGTMPTDRTFTGQRLEAQSLVGSLMDYGARFYYPQIGRFISADSIVPGATNPQALNRYSYGVNNPLKYTDPSGHCFGWAGGADTAVCAGLLFAGPPGWVVDAALIVVGVIVVAGVGIVVANQIDQANKAATSGQVNQQSQPPAISPSGQVGSPTGPGGPDPFDPQRWDGTYQSKYQRFIKAKFNAQPDPANYDIHHVLPQKYGDILRNASNGRIDVDSPGLLREVLKKDSVTGELVHQRLYTDVWESWGRELGRQPTAREIIQFARQLEDQYSIENTLFYRNDLLDRVDWEAVLKLLAGGK